ncbi:MAG: glycosyltransferase family 39 protein [Candidatus Omnitrophica bacterium]|nr:glycosyltransferase family 39 protein [Candidatus Omnitrophota bacterium]
MLKKLLFNPQIKICILVLVIILISLGSLLLTSRQISFYPKADEGIYLNYAVYTQANGLGAFRQFFQAYLGNLNLWQLPNPLRILYIVFSAFWLKLMGVSLLNLAYFSMFCFMGFLLVNFYFARIYFGQRLAVLFLVLLSFSPLNLAMARRALLESCLMLFTSLSVWLFFGLLKNFNKLNSILFVFAFSCAILIKETAALCFIFFLGWHLWQNWLMKRRIALKEFLIIYVSPCLLVALIYYCLGVLFFIPATAKIILFSPSTNNYAVFFGSGPWYRYIIDYLILSPWILILSFGYIMVILLNKGKEDKTAVFLCAFLVFNFFIFNFFTKNARYIMSIDMPMRIFALLMLDRICKRYMQNKSFIIVSILIVFLAFSDYLRFYILFVQQGIYDPMSFRLLSAVQIIPFK